MPEQEELNPNAGAVKAKELHEKPEAVNHPQHYNMGKIEVIEYIDSVGFGRAFALGNAIKYIARAGHKGSRLEDLRKARFYINHVIEKRFSREPFQTDYLISIESIREDWQLPLSLSFAIHGIIEGSAESLETSRNVLDAEILFMTMNTKDIGGQKHD